MNIQSIRKATQVSLFFLLVPVFVSTSYILTRNSISSGVEANTPLPLSNVRGYMTTPQELANINTKAQAQIEPYLTNRNKFLADSQYVGTGDSWSWGTMLNEGTYRVEDIGDSFGSCGTAAQEGFLKKGAASAYAKAMAFHLTNDVSYAVTVRAKLLELSQTFDYGGESYSGGNNCILELGWSIPMWVQAADLLGDWSGWTASDKLTFQGWLAEVAYKKTAWSSRVRKNNWGAGGSAATVILADYVHGSGYTLNEVQPVAKTLTPAQAYQEHTNMQLDRMNTVWKGDSQCTIWGIQSHGGFPDELRRGSTGCLGQYLLEADSAHAYMSTIGETFILSAEVALRRGNQSLYDNISAVDGSGSILQLIRFVIDNPTQSFDWSTYKKSPLYAAFRYYKHQSIKDRLMVNNTSQKSSDVWAWGRLTHDFGISEFSGQVPLPPTVPAPSDVVVTSTPTLDVTPTAEPTLEVTATPTVEITPTVIVTNTPTAIPTMTASPTPVLDVTAPTVLVTAPLNGATVQRGKNVTITASASDNTAVQLVEFYVVENGITNLKCSDSTAQYSCVWRVPSGTNITYSISAKAYDAAGNTSSHTINVVSR